MQIYDTVLKKKVDLIPLNNNEINIYVCGPTVYDHAHLGHAKSSISFDLLRRVLIALGYSVKFVKNFTDIDDKILAKMSSTNQTLEQITTHYIDRYLSDMRALNVLNADIEPKATNYLNAIIDYIQKLEQNGATYKLEDGIYFDTSKDEKYLSLSGRKDENLIARVSSNESKKDDKDFVLWKFDENWYDSPFGKGRPGWHTECVAMIEEIFAKTIDIHAGGADLLFPHHENEAAQCRCGYHKDLANHWIHNGFIQVDNEKMSKSLGNSFFIKDALAIAPGEAVRFYVMRGHYRANCNDDISELLGSEERVEKMYRLKKRLSGVEPSRVDDEFKSLILEALSDDLNISIALAKIDEMVNQANTNLDKEPKNKALKSTIMANLNFIKETLGILYQDEFEWFQYGFDEAQKEQISNLIKARNEAKSAKNYEKADLIRDELNSLGVAIMDTPNGVKWEKIWTE